MIVPMKRLTLLCLAAEREVTVDAVSELGVVHVVPSQPPEGERLEAARAALARGERALSLLRLAVKHAPQQADAEVHLTADEAVARATDLDAVRKERQERAEACERELSEYAPFGEFEPAAVSRLAAAGLRVELGRAAAESRLSAPPGLLVRELGRDEHGVAFCVIGREPFELDTLELGAPVSVTPLPERSLTDTRQLLANARGEAAEAEAELAGLTPLTQEVAAHVRELKDAARFATVRDGMGEGSTVAFLQGYVPADSADDLRESAARHGWGVVFDDPEAHEPVPTLLRYRRWVKPVLTLFDFLRIYPGYREDDVGLMFLLFFSLFFGMLVGDCVYGLLLVAVALAVRARFPRVPRHMVVMLIIVGAVTAGWGVLTGSYLGIKPLPGFLKALQIGWLKNRNNLIELTFLIGAIHLTLAHLWNIVEVRPRTKIIAQVGWIVVLWSMFLLARTMVLGHPMPAFLPYSLLAGVACVALFMATRQEFKRTWINHALLPLTIIGNFVDVLSYVRLYAVGYASVAVIQSFNGMASSIGWHNPLTAVIALLLLLFAHSLNLMLCALAVLVHAVRLNTLEFSTHKGISWQGFAFEPFHKASARS